MPDATAVRHAPFAARLLATLVAFELGEDTVAEMLRLAVAERRLTAAEVWACGDEDEPDRLVCSSGDGHGASDEIDRAVDVPLRFGDRTVGRLVATVPGAADLDALGPLGDALGLLLADREPGDRYDTLARRFDRRRHLIETIMEQLPVGVAVTNTVGVFQLVNQRMADIFGYGLTGTSVETWSAGAARLTRLDGSPVTGAELPLARTLATGEQVAAEEFVFRTAGRADVIIATSSAPVLDAGGGLVACVITCSDVTASHQASRDLAATRRDLDIEIRDLNRVQSLIERLSGTAGAEESLADVLEAVGDLHDSHAGVVMVHCAQTGVLRVAAQRGLTESQVAALAAIDQTELTTSRGAMHGRETVVADARTDPRFSRRWRAVMELFGAVAVHTIPLRTTDGKVIGALASFFDHSHRSSARELAMIDTCARIGAQLIANASARAAEQRITRELQLAMLPHELPGPPGVELAARYRPATEGMLAGGDWYDVTELPDGRLGLAIGDVVGHGVAAAAEMGQVRSAVRAYALTDGVDPSALIGKMDRFADATGVGLMTTLAVLAVDPAARTARLASAGHLPPLVLGADGPRFAHRDGLSAPLGLLDTGSHASLDLVLEPGTTVVLYTDGLVERRGEDIDAGLARLAAAAATHVGTVEDLCDHILAACTPDDGNRDDVAILALRVTA